MDSLKELGNKKIEFDKECLNSLKVSSMSASKEVEGSGRDYYF